MIRQSARAPLEPVTGILAELHRRNRTLFVVALANLGLAIVFTILMQFDGRMLLGRNVWTKPWKFATSITIFTATMAWLLPTLSPSDRVEQLATATIGTAMTVEIALISLQATRGVASHFNTSTPVDYTIYVVMGITITVSSTVVGYVLYRFVRAPPALPPAYSWGLGLGLLLFVLASFEGWLMVVRQSHAVGAPNDAPGLPLLNWSVTGGDLRVAHFLGLHALQVLPLTGYCASRWGRLTARQSLATVAVVGGLYTLVVAGTFVLALRGVALVRTIGHPAIPPSYLAATALLAMAIGAGVLAAAWGRQPSLAATPGE